MINSNQIHFLNVSYKNLILITTIVAFITIILGAYTRLSNAGLGCPDWPGCYGQMTVPSSEQEILYAQEHFPDNPLQQDKARTEMLHRYVAGTLGLLILLITFLSWRRRGISGQPLVLPIILLLMVIFQALLGMWTVTLLLKPLVVVLHLIFGFTTLVLLFILYLKTAVHFKPSPIINLRSYKTLAILALVILSGQIILGGWTSSNYAALACTDLPQCQGKWLPDMNFNEAFTFWRGTGTNYEGGVLSSEGRTAIHISHRLGAVVTAITLMSLCFILFKQQYDSRFRKTALVIASLTILQIGLGAANILFSLPLINATTHNATAALLLLSLIFLNYLLFKN